MDGTIELVERYGRQVFEHTTMDVLRKSDCLCLNCAKLGNCPIADAGFELCKTHGVAYAMTRCPEFDLSIASDLVVTEPVSEKE